VEGLSATARDTLRTVHAYLEQHRAHIDYATYKALGLPLGSGMVESACKWLIHQRFKGVGMGWGADGYHSHLCSFFCCTNGHISATSAASARCMTTATSSGFNNSKMTGEHHRQAV
jgi:hypothetical protein